MPTLFIIAGCNGAGKTTASYNVLPDLLNCQEFVNADEIARGISPFHPEKVSIQAGRIMLNRINELIFLKENFALETTLTTLSYQQTIRKAQDNGYKVALIFFWLNNVNLAIQRVKARVKEGGHDIPLETIKRRYVKGLKNLFKNFLSICDEWTVIDNSKKKYLYIAEKGEKILIHEPKTWELLKTKADEKD